MAMAPMPTLCRASRLAPGPNLQPANFGFNQVHDIGTHAAHAGVHAGGTGAWVGASRTGQTVHNHHTGILIHGAGGNGAHNNMPPFLALHFIIRFQ